MKALAEARAWLTEASAVRSYATSSDANPLDDLGQLTREQAAMLRAEIATLLDQEREEKAQ